MTTIRPRLTRRDILRGTGAAAALLPLFDARPARAADPPPKRLIIVASFNGTVPEAWWPTGGETDFVLGRILEPLEAHRKDIVVVGGLRNRLSETDPALRATKSCPGHTSWMHAFTGRLGDPAADAAWNAVRGPSVDQFIADKLNPSTKFRSLQLRVGKPNETNPVIFSMTGRRMDGDYDLNAIYKRLFSNFLQPPEALEKLRVQRRSVLDFSHQQLQSLVGLQLGADAGKKLQAHLEAVRSIERSLDAVMPAVCAPPAAPGTDGVWTNESLPAMAKLHVDILVAALACDLTRFVSLEIFWGGQGGIKPVWLGLNEDAHGIAHDLLSRMKATAEAGRTMLDRSVILWMNIMAQGGHVPSPPAVVLAGGGGGWKTGRFLKVGEAKLGKLSEGTAFIPHNDLLVSICRGMGVDVDAFGSPGYSTGPLAALG